MDEEKEADYDDYCSMIEKVLGRNNSQMDDGDEETKYDSGSDTNSIPQSNMGGEDQDATNAADSLENMLQQVTQDAADEEEDREDDEEEDSDSSSGTNQVPNSNS